MEFNLITQEGTLPPLISFFVVLLVLVLVALAVFQSRNITNLNTTIREISNSYDDAVRALKDQLTELTRKANTATYDHTNQTGIITAQALRIEELENLAKEQQAQVNKAAAMSEVIRQVKAETTTYMDVNGRTRKRNPTTKTMAALSALVE